MIVSIAGYKGGIGKTTTAVHLAAHFVEHAPTVLVDGDNIRSATQWNQNGGLPFEVVNEEELGKAVTENTHVVIDTQGRPEQEDLEELANGSDLMIVPSFADAMSLRGLFMTIDALENLGLGERYAILLTSVPPWPSRDGKDARKMLDDEGLEVIGSHISQLGAFRKAALAGVPVYEVKDRLARRAWSEYEKVGEEVLAKYGG
jgi:chromosome partitioning protein